MYCEYCGNKIEGTYKFCTKCGRPVGLEMLPEQSPGSKGNQKWWYRLAKVIYIFLYILLAFTLVVIWNENSYYSADSTPIWPLIVTFAIWVVVARLIKITFLYVVFAQKPQWKKEFKKFF